MNKDDDSSNTQEREPEKGDALKSVINFFLYVAIIAFASWAIVTFVGQRTEVSGSSMESTLSNGDNLIVSKISYRISAPKRFDIVIFPYQYAEKTYFIKRVIGLPGETVYIDDTGTIYINGDELKEHYGRETILDPGDASTPITLGPDEYFVMGDNRNNSMDSRDPRVGLIHRRDIIGKAVLRIYPFSRFGSLSGK